jgi:hypothetical protein
MQQGAALPEPGALAAADRSILILLDLLIEDVVDALELWQAAGYDDCRWVWSYWSRCVPPQRGLDPPATVRAAVDAHELHRALLEWQDEVIAALL